MTKQIKDGGPAFSTENARQTGPITWHHEGMTLRDYFAAHEPLDPNESIGKALAEKLAGRRMPDAERDEFADPHEFALAVALFWADAEAAYRYLRADAMLRAREGGAA